MNEKELLQKLQDKEEGARFNSDQSEFNKGQQAVYEKAIDLFFEHVKEEEEVRQWGLKVLGVNGK